MLTKWAKRILACSVYVNNNSFILPHQAFSVYQNALIEAKMLDGTTIYIPPFCAGSASTSIIGNAFVQTGTGSSVGFAVGSGNTMPTENDYTLENKINGISGAVTQTTVYDSENRKYIKNNDISISNGNDTNITIAEIGVFATFYKATTIGVVPSSNNNNKASVMIERTLLNNPVTIPAGEARVIRYRLEFDVS